MKPHYDTEYLKMLAEDGRQPLTIKELAQIIVEERAEASSRLETVSLERDEWRERCNILSSNFAEFHKDKEALIEQRDAAYQRQDYTMLQLSATKKALFDILGTVQGSNPAPYKEIKALAEAALDGFRDKRVDPYHQPKGKDILGSLPDIQEVCGHCWGEGSHHVVGGPREKCEFCDGTGKA